MEFTISSIGFAELADALGATIDNIQTDLEQVAIDTAIEVRSAAQDKVPKRSFNLARSIIAEDTDVGAIVTVNALYGKFVEFGTGLYGPAHHLITSKNGGPMVWQDGDNTIFAMTTKGMHPKPYFIPAVQAAFDTIDEKLDTFMQNIIAALAGS
jgi:HK97 gp10 family phage protein